MYGEGGEGSEGRACGNCGDDYANGGWSVRDACTASGVACIVGQDDNEVGCGVSIAARDCRDADFDAW